MLTEPRITQATKEEKKYIYDRLVEFNAKHVPQELQSRYQEINLSIKDENGVVVAGLLAWLQWNWIEVDILWVDETCRKSGYGSRLLTEIEAIAREKQCTFLKLNTFSFQAPEFYKRHGFELYGVLEEAPLGSSHYFFRKSIHN